MPDKEYFCPSCKKFVKKISSRFGTQVMPDWTTSAGELPVFVCEECETPVMEFVKSKKKAEVL